MYIITSIFQQQLVPLLVHEEDDLLLCLRSLEAAGLESIGLSERPWILRYEAGRDVHCTDMNLCLKKSWFVCAVQRSYIQ